MLNYEIEIGTNDSWPTKKLLLEYTTAFVEKSFRPRATLKGLKRSFVVVFIIVFVVVDLDAVDVVYFVVVEC